MEQKIVDWVKYDNKLKEYNEKSKLCLKKPAVGADIILY